MSDMNPYQQPQSDVANAAPASANEFTICLLYTSDAADE